MYLKILLPTNSTNFATIKLQYNPWLDGDWLEWGST